jgi:glycosyltransferase involved in cell wall biosynthesis
MSIKKRIYIAGDAYGSYRARALLEYLASSPKYGYFYHDRMFFTPKNNSLFCRVFFKGVRIIDNIIKLPYLMVSDIVYILPMASLYGIERLIIRLFKKDTIGEFYISMFDTFINDRKTVDAKSYRAKVLLKADQNFMDICDQVVFLNASERAYYLKLIDRQSAVDKTTLIPLATDHKDKACLPYANSQTEILTLCWWGTFIPLHGLEKIIETAKFLKERNLNFKLYLFGTSEEKSLPYKKKIFDMGLEKFVFIDNEKTFADKSLDRFLVTHCDIAFGNFGDSEKAKTVMVNKVVESASLGLPVISQKTLALAEYFKDNESIYFCESEPEKIVQKIIELSKNREHMMSIANSASRLYDARFSKDAYLHDIVNILNSVD